MQKNPQNKKSKVYSCLAFVEIKKRIENRAKTRVWEDSSLCPETSTIKAVPETLWAFFVIFMFRIYITCFMTFVTGYGRPEMAVLHSEWSAHLQPKKGGKIKRRKRKSYVTSTETVANFNEICPRQLIQAIASEKAKIFLEKSGMTSKSILCLLVLYF